MNRPPTPYRARLLPPELPGSPTGPVAILEVYGPRGRFRVDELEGRFTQFKLCGESDVEVLAESWLEGETWQVILDIATYGNYEPTEFGTARGAWLDG